MSTSMPLRPIPWCSLRSSSSSTAGSCSTTTSCASSRIGAMTMSTPARRPSTGSARHPSWSAFPTAPASEPVPEGAARSLRRPARPPRPHPRRSRAALATDGKPGQPVSDLAEHLTTEVEVGDRLIYPMVERVTAAADDAVWSAEIPRPRRVGGGQRSSRVTGPTGTVSTVSPAMSDATSTTTSASSTRCCACTSTKRSRPTSPTPSTRCSPHPSAERF